ncbi:MAG: RNA-binding S4 domain-containing protein [Bacteroidaceae bacterium]|nr:RNA-binding S4 domain-containing protein [Bacteroidaceae bacterium]
MENNNEEKWRENFAQNEGNEEKSSYGNTGRTPRPRIQRPVYGSSADGERRTYQNRNSFHQEGGYQPREGGYKPRFNREGGYQQREGGYKPRFSREGGYQQREGGYQPRFGREGGFQQREGGYKPRFGREGGFQQREGGYQPRFNREGGFQQREGGYQPRFGREGGYQQRGGFQRGGFQGRGGYGQRGGFQQRRPRTADYDPNAKYSFKKRIEYSEAHIDPEAPIRLNKFLANAGVCSRREADTFIEAGVVSVNGVVVTELGTKVKRTDEVKFHDQPVKIEKKVYVLLNKPKDYVTTSDDPQNRKTVMDLVKDACDERIYPVGRLDRNTTGVLLLTNDGELASKLTHPKFLKKKIYHVHTDKNVTAADMRQIAEGITLDDGDIRADAVEYASETDRKQIGIEIHSGRNRIVRRIFEHLGYKVTKLDRVLFAGLTKKNLKRGDWRYLTEEEVNMLRMGAFE